MKRLTLASAALALGATVFSCNEHNLAPLGDTLFVESTQAPSQITSNAVDILWVVDDSGSMKDEQVELAKRFDEFMTALAALGADFRLAVVSTDPRSSGQFRTRPGNVNQAGLNCREPLPEVAAACADVQLGVGNRPPFLRASDYLPAGSDDFTAVDVDAARRDFACISSAGDCGLGFEAGLGAVRRALSPELLASTNGDFLRDDAFLVVIFLSDEDDCTTADGRTPAADKWCYASDHRDELMRVQDVYDAILAAKGGRAESVLVAGLIGDDDNLPLLPESQFDQPPIACNAQILGSEGEVIGDVSARDGERYRELIELFGATGLVESICQANFSSALANIGRILSQSINVNCVAANPVPQTCTSDADCAPGVACMQPGDPIRGQLYCQNFEIKVDVNTGDGWRSLVSPGPVGQSEAAPGAEYTVDYDASQCASGIAFRFASGIDDRPGPGDSYRITYPVEVDISPVVGGTISN